MLHLPELPSTPRTQLYSAQFLERALELFEREGLWLLLSLHHYGWRAHRDMTADLLADRTLEGLGRELAVHHREHRSMAALEELFLLLDEIWRTVSGIRSFRDGDGFLAGYRRYGGNVQGEYEQLQELNEDDWRTIFSLPSDEDVADVLTVRGGPEITEQDIETARELIADLLSTTLLNMHEAGRLFARVQDAAGAEARSVRDINNAYRHGTQVVYEDCSPAEISWRAANPAEGESLLIGVDEVHAAAREDTVNVLLEGPDEEGHARFASMPRGEAWADDLIRSTEHLSVLLHRLVVSFLLGEVSGEPVLGTLVLDWEQLNAEA